MKRREKENGCGLAGVSIYKSKYDGVGEVQTKAASLRTQYGKLLRPKPSGSSSDKDLTPRQSWMTWKTASLMREEKTWKQRRNCLSHPPPIKHSVHQLLLPHLIPHHLTSVIRYSQAFLGPSPLDLCRLPSGLLFLSLRLPSGFAGFLTAAAASAAASA
ncbi:hypothetical protein G5714_020393 [Onychostoma macrolepis]|uniref:Uncharacterized protein n=1 Tax=Onychostoma macrolepis TaxID=369639 RepID=A0A7J6BV42_9TELE|nr:hypothetical protein G5714_020393 [Onychostoma macrolepis]